MTDGVHGYVNFGEEHLIAGAAPEVVVDGGCELVLVREKSMQQPREISAPLACGRIRRRREGRGLMREKIRRRGGFGDGSRYSYRNVSDGSKRAARRAGM